MFDFDYTIAHSFTLPSEGKVYAMDVKPEFKIRSMTTAEEMKRLNHSERPYMAMAEIMDSCLVDKIGISAYDLCVADYQFMLHKLRLVTYGPKYKLSSTCPYCGTTNTFTVDLSDIPVKEFDKDEYEKYSEFLLPVTQKKIKLRMQTPRILDNINVASREQRKKNPQATGDPAFLFTLQNLIETIGGEKPDSIKIQYFVQHLPMMDTNYILKSAQKLNSMFGIDSQLVNTCRICGLDYTSNFRTTSEFFGPSID